MFKKLIATVAFVIAGFMPAVASAAECSLYEQSHPAFTLDGAHLSSGKCSTCASCHKGGVFMGTPKTCIACHNGDPIWSTVGRSSAHIPTQTVNCDACHKTTLFTLNAKMNHTAVVTSRCDSCHGGAYLAYNAMKKPQEHIPTTADCNTCHKSTSNWDASHAQIHAGVTTGCVTCHNNQTAVGKASYSLGHPVTSDNCETCHSIDNKFKCASMLDKLRNYAWVLKNRFIG